MTSPPEVSSRKLGSGLLYEATVLNLQLSIPSMSALADLGDAHVSIPGTLLHVSVFLA